MKRIFSLLLFLVGILAGFSDQASAQVDPAFGAHFRKLSEIQLDNRIPIGSVGYLDVSSRSDFLVVDPIGKQVILYNANGMVKKVLSVSSCNPGISWNPEKAFFRPDGSILVANGSYPWMIFFSLEGECQRTSRINQYARNYCVTNDKIYVLTMDRLDMQIKEYDYWGSIVRTLATLPKRYPNIDTRSDFNGLTCTQSHIYAAMASSPDLFEYDFHGRLTNLIRIIPSYHRTITRDADVEISTDIRALMAAFEEINKNKSVTYSVMNLDTGKIVMQFLNGESQKYGVQVIDINSRSRDHQGEIRTSRLFFQAMSGRLYAIIQPELKQDGSLDNPSIHVYTYLR